MEHKSVPDSDADAKRGRQNKGKRTGNGSRYSKDEIERFLRFQVSGWSGLYNASAVNYKSTTRKTEKNKGGVPCTEIIAAWISEGFDEFSKSITQIERTDNTESPKGKPYFTKSHTAIRETKKTKASNRRKEEKVAQELYIQQSSSGWDIGKVIDYQTPLKNSEFDIAGKIDLLALSENKVLILELKKEGSDETLLRCILEAYTYFKTIKNRMSFLRSFDDIPCNMGIDSFAICPLFFKDSQPDKDRKSSPRHLMELVEKIEKDNVEVRFYRIDRKGSEDVKDWRIEKVGWEEV